MPMMRGFRMDPSITKQKLKPGTVRRIATYARPYRIDLALFLLVTAVDAVITVVNPLLLREIIDSGILARNDRVVILIALAVAAVAIFDAGLGFVIRWFSARIGEGLIYDLRTQVFDHVQRQPIAFFTRAQTGSLVSRLDGDVVGAQQAITSTLSGVVSNLLSLVVILITLFYLSWLVSLIALLMIPMFILPARVPGPGGASVAPEIEFDDVSFRYPTAAEVSLASLESIALAAPERPASAAAWSSRAPSRSARSSPSPRCSAGSTARSRRCPTCRSA